MNQKKTGYVDDDRGDAGEHKTAEGIANEHHASRRDSVPHKPRALASFTPDRWSRSGALMGVALGQGVVVVIDGFLEEPLSSRIPTTQ